MKKPTYDEIFQRNIGVFTKEEQEKIKKLKVAIAGAGGLGGPVAYYLARLGVGVIKLADFDQFEVSNINRQYGSYINTIGKNKAQSIAGELKKINPYLKTEVYEEGVNEKNIDKFLLESDIVIDGIDFFNLEDAILLYKKAREMGLWVFTSQAAKELLTFTSYDPVGTTFEELVCEGNLPDIIKAINSFFPVLPRGIKKEDIVELVKSGAVHISSHSTPPNIGGGILVEDIIGFAIKGMQPKAKAPNVLVFDLDNLSSRIYDVKKV